MEATGKISKINAEYRYGFITTKDRKEVFFSPTTNFSSTNFDALSVNDEVRVEIEQTTRGLFAKTLTVVALRKRSSTATTADHATTNS